MFDEKKYTEDSIIKQLTLIQLHSTDGSALDAGCSCVEGKHLHALEGFAEEATMTAENAQEKAFYENLAEVARQTRKAIEEGKFGYLPHNPARKYHPSGLTECEKTHPHVLKKLASCIKKLEPREKAGEIESAVAVCRASIKCVEGSFNPKDVTKITTIDYPKDMGKKPAVSEISLDTGKILVHLNPKLKENPKLEKAILEHELREGACIYNATIDCHNQAVKHEPKGTRKQIHALGLGHR
jgi:hypothetical protein